MNRDPETRSSIERMSAAIAGDRVPDLSDMTRVLRAAEEHDRGMPRRPYPARSGQSWPRGTVARVRWTHGDDVTTWLAWWSEYDQQWISDAEGPIDRSLPLLVEPLVVLDCGPGSQHAGRRAAAAQLYLAAEDSDGERERLLTWLAEQISPDESAVCHSTRRGCTWSECPSKGGICRLPDPPGGIPDRDVPYVHAVLYRDHVLGSLCNSGAYGTPELFTAVTQEVTCPGCRDKLEGARA